MGVAHDGGYRGGRLAEGKVKHFPALHGQIGGMTDVAVQVRNLRQGLAVVRHPRTALRDDDGIRARTVRAELKMPRRGHARPFNQRGRTGIAEEWVCRTIFRMGQPRERVASA